VSTLTKEADGGVHDAEHAKHVRGLRELPKSLVIVTHGSELLRRDGLDVVQVDVVELALLFLELKLLLKEALDLTDDSFILEIVCVLNEKANLVSNVSHTSSLLLPSAGVKNYLIGQKVNLDGCCIRKVLSASSKIILPAVNEGFVIARTAMEVVTIQAVHSRVALQAKYTSYGRMLLDLLSRHTGYDQTIVHVYPQEHEHLVTLL
jgi:hypothetical protein